VNGYAYDESGRRRWVLIAGAAVAIVVLLAVGFIGGRASAPSVGAGGTRVVNVQSGPGPTHVVNGVPVGYAHTQAGAVAAATNYLETYFGPLVTQPDKYRAAVNEMADPDTRNTLNKLADGNLTGQASYMTYAAQGRAVVHRVVPLAYSVRQYSSASAQVSIWAETLLAVDGVLSLREGWATTTVTTQWATGDWKLSNIPTAAGGPDSSFGPVPTSVQAPSQSVNLPTQLVDFRSYQAYGT
jgi:hypothetical protein